MLSEAPFAAYAWFTGIPLPNLLQFNHLVIEYAAHPGGRLQTPALFISYVRRESAQEAHALYDALGGQAGPAFFDKREIEVGGKFVAEIAEAILSSRVFVLFLSPSYFSRPFCVREFHLALQPYLALLQQSAPTGSGKDNALAHFVVALSRTGSEEGLRLLPPTLQTLNWPPATDTSALAELVLRKLQLLPSTLTEILGKSASERAVQEIARWSEMPTQTVPQLVPGIEVTIYPDEFPPSIGDRLVGRADHLWLLHHVLYTLRIASASGAPVVSIEASGGFGKTRLALEYLRRYAKDYYPGGSFWFDADIGPDRLEECFHGALKVLRPTTVELRVFREQKRNAARELNNAIRQMPADKPALFVADNIPEPEAGRSPEPLKTWCPAVGFAPALLTSRLRVSAGEGFVRSFRLYELPAEDAETLLKHEVPDAYALSSADWQAIAEWAGHLPLALNLLNAALREGYTPAELLEAARKKTISSELDALMEALRGSVPAGVLKGVTESLHISYERLSEEGRAAARLLSFLAPDPIPLALIEKLGIGLKVRSELMSRSFIVRSEGDLLFGTIHRVLADFLRRLEPHPAGCIEKHKNALLELMPESNSGDARYWRLFSACMPHMAAIQAYYCQEDLALPPEGCASLGLILGLSHHANGNYREAIGGLERALAFSKSRLGSTCPAVVRLASLLSDSLFSAGDYAAARKLDEETLAKVSDVLGPDDVTVITMEQSLACVLDAQGDFAGARALTEKCLEKRRRVLGEDSRETMASMGILADHLTNLGEYPTSIELQKRCLALCRKVAGPEHMDTLIAMGGMASTLNAIGDIEAARKLNEETLGLMKKVLGLSHPVTYIITNNLASVLMKMGDLAEARSLLMEANANLRKTLGPEHPNTITTQSNYASLLRQMGDNAAARTVFEEVLSSRTHVQGKEHPDSLLAAFFLADACLAMKDLAAARQLFEQSLQLHTASMGPEHLGTLASKLGLARTLQLQGDCASAREMLSDVLSIARRVYGETHSVSARATEYLLDTLRALGDEAAVKALELETAALQSKQQAKSDRK
ncbi:MAG: toll/interleukin-1 receptor domain-containing protein [Candidatus Brocadiia bacterium]